MSLIDSRVKKQAEILVKYSVRAKKGERAVILADFGAKPLVLEIYKLLVKSGVLETKVYFNSYELSEIFYKNATDIQLKSFPQMSMDEVKKTDCWIAIRSSSNTRGLTGVDAKKITLRSKTTRKISNWRVEKTKWVITNFPTNALAQEADMSLSDYSDFLFSAINGVDWSKKYKQQEKLRKIVDKVKKVRIIGPGTDLVLDITGRKCINAGGKHNMPDGEVFTSVLENGSNGVIEYSYPAVYLGREFHDVRLEFKSGKVISAKASKGEKDLNEILNIDSGARRIGELGIGNNFKIKKFTKDILFDEKIGGSIHLALGKGYKETGSKNHSAIHWDMIKDLRLDGELWFDSKLVQKNGKWLIKI